MFNIPVSVSSSVTIDGYYIPSTGFGDTYTLAALKARSELIERIYTSDLMNEDSTGLFTYRHPTYWCSTGSAAHPDREICLSNSMAEIIERDMLACWMAISRVYAPITIIHNIELWEIPCMYKDWYVIVSVKRQLDRTQITCAASKDINVAMVKAFYEAFLRPTLPPAFIDSRLPTFTVGDIKRGDYPAPDLFLREWKVDDLFVTKYYGYHVSDFRRGISTIKSAEYIKFMGLSEWTQLQLHRSWFS